MFFKTISGSIYEIDQNSKRIKRHYRKRSPTTRQENGDWRTYANASEVILGKPVLIWWDNDSPVLALPGMSPGTLTSLVVEIFEGEVTTS